MTITPDQARDLLDGATPGPWWIHPAYGTVEPDVISGEGCRFVATDEDLNLSAKAPGMAQTIAGMTWEYAVEHEHTTGNWHRVTEWGPEENPYRAGYGPGDDERIVRRLVGPVEVVDGE